MEQSFNNQALEYIKQKRRGKIFFKEDFKQFGTAENVQFILFFLCEKNILTRLGSDIYYYPKADKLYPSVDEIIKEVAKRKNIYILPTGPYALYRLGFSKQEPANIVFQTNGMKRRIKIGPKKLMFLEHIITKKLAFKCDMAMLLTVALREITKERITPEHVERLKSLLKGIPKKEIFPDLGLMPLWISDLIMKNYR